ncbi:FAD-dependent monooxygenase [Moraxella sp. Pampa]|uniref:FAD-dependent monooxygenase n=1 Tax=Moraxella sp. Pampa TaxID=3111978 RepID=UPI002B402ABF|nr:FAD-dependent monooxygenase [Moraxella sp. Pampa]
MKTDNMVQINTDVLVVGGGAVGMTLAIGLAKLKKTVMLIDVKPKLSVVDEQMALNRRDARVYALNLASLNLFDGIGIGIDVFQRRADYTKMQVWQGDGRGELNFAKQSLTPRLLGSMIEPAIIDEALRQRAMQADITPYLTVLHGTWIDEHFGIDVRPKTVCVRIMNDTGWTKIVNTHLLVGADGRGSVVRRLSGIGVDTLDYHQTAICCAIKTDKAHQHTARQAMLDTGTLALLPLADMSADDGGHWQSVVWTLPTQIAKEFLALSPENLADKLALASSFELGKIHQIQSIASFALSTQVAKSYIAPHTLLIGDAAHGVHPLAGQGLNLGLADVSELLALIANDGKNICKVGLLRQYERARYGKNTLMMHGFSAINYAFVGKIFQKEPMRFIRSEVVNLTGKIRPLMDFFNKKASGF